MKRVLFVDDEERILDGLRRMLRSSREEFEMHFALGGEAALAALAAEPFDVVVTDMRMPQMDGVTLLTHVRERFPGVVRIVLSGHTEAEAVLRTAPIAHQFLSKPTDAERLRAVVSRACRLQALVSDPEMRRAIGGIDSLPTAPRVYAALTAALGDPDVSIGALAAIVEEDLVMSGKVLQLMNSAFFGLPHPATCVRDAVSYLGTETLRSLVMTVEVFHAFRDSDGLLGFSADAEQAHALSVGRIARQIPPDRRLAEEAFTAAMLHDIGKLILARYFSEYFTEVLRVCREERIPMHVVERRLRGITHAEIGAYLLDLWGLPYPIIEAVAHHHAPTEVPSVGLDLPVVVHVADWLAHGGAVGEEGRTSPIDLDHLKSLGLAEALPRWRAIAGDQPAAEE